ncbi:MAG TPA: GNAT family N-acetyltransferase [Casimicrobiaceae bacterium]|jgi:acetyltransferase|nr:GNAT family N-acetyltransferase [Casimicrobiaceae bacterium]
MNRNQSSSIRQADSAPHWLQSYPAHLARTWTLAAGQPLFVRPVRHDDGELEEAFVRALSVESRYQRMLSGGVKVTPEWIDSMTHIDYRRHMAFALTTIDGVERFVGVARYVVDASKPSADVAIVLADAWQRKGLGRRLLETLLEHAASAGITEATGVVLSTNVAMLHLARSMGFAVRPEPGDATVRRISRPLFASGSRQH